MILFMFKVYSFAFSLSIIFPNYDFDYYKINYVLAQFLQRENENARRLVVATGFGHTGPRNQNTQDQIKLAEYLKQILLEMKSQN